ncbi:hypothetical protein K523DRAFT_101424 [Schizophyllum commune Tattone D]|nr:hypothetical protein K523DRAFT_101424 [Schizophyllum commune Tattone D]
MHPRSPSPAARGAGDPYTPLACPTIPSNRSPRRARLVLKARMHTPPPIVALEGPPTAWATARHCKLPCVCIRQACRSLSFNGTTQRRWWRAGRHCRRWRDRRVDGRPSVGETCQLRACRCHH